MKKIIIITHGNLGESLISTAADIIGKDLLNNIKSYSVSGKVCMENLISKLKKETQDSKDEHIIFTDILGGSATNASLTATATDEKTFIISGINLGMLLSALYNRDKLDLEPLVQKITEDGKKSIVNVKQAVNE